MTMDTLIALFIFALVTSATPGPNTLMLLASGVNFGFNRTIPHMLGVVSGFFILLLCVGLGLGVLLTSQDFLHKGLKIIGGGYLLFLSWRIATAGSFSLSLSPQTSEPPARPMRLVAAMLFQWVNPKAWMMGVTAMALYTQSAEPSASVFTIALMYAVVGLPTVALWAGFGSALSNWLEKPGRLKWFNRIMGISLALTVIPMVR